MQQWLRDIAVAVGSGTAITLVVTALRALQAYPNPTIAALLLLLVVVATATVARVRVSIAVSIVSVQVFNFFLLPPFHTFAIADPQNWIALFVFLIVATIASHLSAAARQRASEAESRKSEVARLFDSVGIFCSSLTVGVRSRMSPGMSRAASASKR